MSIKKKTKMVAIKDLQMNLFVRQALNQDHALYLAELVENGVELPPITITNEQVVIDGRHRIEAHDLNDRAEIECEIIDVGVGNEIELIAKAYKANVGGSLPPTPQDTEHTVMLLLERGESKKRIGELLGLPTGMARRYINEVQSKVSRAKLLRASTAVTNGGLTVAKAAEQYNVDPDKIKEILSGRRQKHKQGVVDIQRTLTTTYKSLGIRNASLVRKLIEKYEDGDVSTKQMNEIFAHIEKLQKKSARSISDWKKRFESSTNDISQKTA